MASKKRVGMLLHGITTKYVPGILALITFIYVAPWVTDLQVVPPAIMYVTIAFLFGGLAFIYEGLITWPDNGKYAGMTPSVFMFVIGGINIVFTFLTFFRVFNPFLGSGDLIIFASIMLGFSTIALFITGTIEVILSERFGKWMKSEIKKLV